MNAPVSRLVPDEPFPSYSYIPGRFPHPISAPAGHSFGVEPVPPANVEPERWQDCRPYLYGIDLFNAGYYWESHVAWESLWLACGRKGYLADFLKGLIKLSAAGVKALEGRPAGVKSHAGRAVELWRSVLQSLDPQKRELMGFRVSDLQELAEEVHVNGWPSHPPTLVPIPPA